MRCRSRGLPRGVVRPFVAVSVVPLCRFSGTFVEEECVSYPELIGRNCLFWSWRQKGSAGGDSGTVDLYYRVQDKS